MRLSSLSFALPLAAALTACPGEMGTDAGTDPYQAAEDAAVAAVANYESEGFTKVNDEHFTTQHGASTHANVWVTNAHVAEYKGIDPSDDTDTAGPFPEGTIVIKEQVDDANMRVGRLLVMAKFPADYSETNDWWWALFDDEDTPSDTGQVGFCITCHSESNDFVDTDYLGGVETDNQL